MAWTRVRPRVLQGPPGPGQPHPEPGSARPPGSRPTPPPAPPSSRRSAPGRIDLPHPHRHRLPPRLPVPHVRRPHGRRHRRPGRPVTACRDRPDLIDVPHPQAALAVEPGAAGSGKSRGRNGPASRATAWTTRANRRSRRASPRSRPGDRASARGATDLSTPKMCPTVRADTRRPPATYGFAAASRRSNSATAMSVISQPGAPCSLTQRKWASASSLRPFNAWSRPR